jgi:hypothetical protein
MAGCRKNPLRQRALAAVIQKTTGNFLFGAFDHGF